MNQITANVVDVDYVNGPRIEGIDLSRYDGDVDFATLAKTRKFAITQVSHGASIKDPTFSRNWRGLKEAGIIRGAYHYLRPDENFQEQVDYFINSIGRLEAGDLPPTIDLEEPPRWKTIPKKDRVALIIRFLDAVEKAFNVVPMIYMSPSFVEDVLGSDNARALVRYPLWIANYNVSSPTIPLPFERAVMWQYSERGVVAGVPNDHNCDLDVFFGTMEQLQALTVQHVAVSAAVENAGKAFAVQGCDVSSYQGTIDWAKVATEKKFAFIRVSHGTSQRDVMFRQNWDAAKAHGVIRGPYHYLDPRESVKDQIDYFIQTVGRLEVGDLPPVLDLEDPEAWAGVPKNKRVALILNVLNQWERAFGVSPLVYMSPNFVDAVLGRDAAAPLQKYILWIANYNVAAPRVPAPWESWLFWQYASKGARTAGIEGDCDQDAFNGTLEELKALTVQTLFMPDPDSHGTNGHSHGCCHCHCHSPKRRR